MKDISLVLFKHKPSPEFEAAQEREEARIQVIKESSRTCQHLAVDIKEVIKTSRKVTHPDGSYTVSYDGQAIRSGYCFSCEALVEETAPDSGVYDFLIIVC